MTPCLNERLLFITKLLAISYQLSAISYQLSAMINACYSFFYHFFCRARCTYAHDYALVV